MKVNVVDPLHHSIVPGTRPLERPIAGVRVYDLRRNALFVGACQLQAELPGVLCSASDPTGSRDMVLEMGLGMVALAIANARAAGIGDDVSVARRIGEVLHALGLPADDLQAFGSPR